VGVGGLVGFAAFSAIMTVGAGESTLENMAVAGAWQRKGIGSRLLASGLLWCRAHAAATVFLEVRASNRVAIALYERTGFSAVGNRPGYYREPAEDGLQMQKALGLAARAG
jgi:ribosomal-protein-alanine N-acetyltransferase